ncbi:MAG TPA: hypothetical protein V6D19_04180 [Stenomitos sp.]
MLSSLPRKPKSKHHRIRKLAAVCFIAGGLLATPLVAQNAQALSANYIKYIQQAMQILTLIKSGGLGSLNIGNLGEFLTLFQQIPLEELQGVLKDIQENIDNLDPETKELIGSISGTLGQLGLPIPSEVNSLLSKISESKSDSYGSPFSITHDQALMGALGISSSATANSVLGEQGQENIAKILNTSQDSWQKGADIVQTNGAAIVGDSVKTAIDAQFAFSSQDVLKAISIQNAQKAALDQQMGASNAEQGKIAAMGVNLQSKSLAVEAQSLQLQNFQTKLAAQAEGARQAEAAGAFTSTITNAYMFSCLSQTDCSGQ